MIAGVLPRIRPTPEEERRVEEVVSLLLEDVSAAVRARGLDADVILVGSVAKGTFLKNPDLDVFIRFSTEYSREVMEAEALEIGKTVLERWIISYAEHPYVRGIYRGFDVDIVPCYRVESPSQLKSSVDRTPFHTEYVRRNLPPGRRDDVRLLKAFMKGIGVYGAEARVRGFSGYLTELLVIKYGSFMDVIRAVAKWRIPVRLTLSEGDPHRFEGPMVFVDPTDDRRNAASAVSEETLSLFILACKEFLRAPTPRFFFPEEPDVAKEHVINLLRRRRTCIYAISLPSPEIHPDTLHDQARKLESAVADIAWRAGFKVLDTSLFIGDRIIVLLELDRCEVPGVKVHEGPPVDHPNTVKFIEKWTRENRLRGPYVKGRRVYVDVERDAVEYPEVLMRWIGEIDIGKNLNDLKGEMRCENIDEGNMDRYLKELSAFLTFTLPWLGSKGGVDK